MVVQRPPAPQEQQRDERHGAHAIAAAQTVGLHVCGVDLVCESVRVPLEQGLATFTALQRRGIDSRLLFFPNENHWVLRPANSVQWAGFKHDAAGTGNTRQAVTPSSTADPSNRASVKAMPIAPAPTTR